MKSLFSRLFPPLLPDCAVKVLILVMFSPLHMWAGLAGSVSGRVLDPTGAIIPGVSVTISAIGSNLKRMVVTDAEGSYTFFALPPGQYQIETRLDGFRPYLQSNLQIESGNTLQQDINLNLEEQNTAVTVTESSLHVETADTTLGDTLNAPKISSVPLNGRSYTDLLALQPGVVPASSRQPNAVVMSGCTSNSPSGDLNPGNLSVSGQRETSNGFQLNGSMVQEGFNMGSALVPNLDSIEDLQVLTTNYAPEYGNFSGGQVVVTTKSGTNELHGSGFEFLRDTNLDARNFFSSDRARYAQHQFGGTLGGPLKKEKLFFFMDYQGTRTTQGVETGLISVPSAAERAGDMADAAGTLTGAVNGQYWADLLSENLGYAVSPGEPYYLIGCTTSAQCVLPQAQIPSNAWSAPAKALLSAIPLPNAGSNMFTSSAYNETVRDDKASFRLDTRLRFGNLALYDFFDDYTLNNPYPTAQGGANVPGFNAVTMGRSQLLNMGLTSILSPSTINRFHFSYLRDANNVGVPQGGVGPSLASQGFVNAAGAPSIVPLAPQIQGVENVSFNDLSFGVDTTGLYEANNTFQLSDDLSKSHGSHLFKVGGGYHFDEVNIHPDAIYNGSFSFTGAETGLDFADYLLGVPSSYSQGDSLAFYLRNHYAAIYAQDSWHTSQRLTLNYGVRWDLLPPWSEKYNQLQTLAFGQQSVVYPGAPRGLVFPGDPGIPSTLASARHLTFAPRLGAAYSPGDHGGLLGRILGPSGTSSLRAGLGLYYSAFEGLSAGIMSANPPYGYDYTSLAPPLFSNPFITAASGLDVGQRFPEPIPAFGASATNPNKSVNWSQYLPITGVPSFFHGNTSPYSANYTVSFERQLAGNTLLSFAYVGTQAHHLLALISANPGNPALCLSLSQRSDVAPASATCGPFGEGGTYTTAAGNVVQGTRGPFGPQFDAVTYQKTLGNSNYNALQIDLRHNHGPLEFLVGYTYSKSLDQSSSLAEAINPIDPGLSKALSAFDMRQNMVFSYKYQLPTGYLTHRWSRLIQGWSMTGITRFSTGFPVTLYNNNDTSLLGTIPNGINDNGVDTPSVVPGALEINRDPRNGRPAFNPALFGLPALGQLGTAAPRYFGGPGMNNFDLALFKDIHFNESKWLQIRVEAFNAFNHAQFYGAAAVNGNISSSSFGRFISADTPRLVQLAAKLYF